jgi:hypothetical protein
VRHDAATARNDHAPASGLVWDDVTFHVPLS